MFCRNYSYVLLNNIPRKTTAPKEGGIKAAPITQTKKNTKDKNKSTQGKKKNKLKNIK